MAGRNSTSAVTGYFATLGSNTPPLAYEDIELCDMMMHFGHNARESHPTIFWRAADHKKKNDIPIVVADPRRTGTVMGYEDINPKNTVHVPIFNGDISFLNSLAHALLKEHKDVIDWDFMKQHTTGWKEYINRCVYSRSHGGADVSVRPAGRAAGFLPLPLPRRRALFAAGTLPAVAHSPDRVKTATIAPSATRSANSGWIRCMTSSVRSATTVPPVSPSARWTREVY